MVNVSSQIVVVPTEMERVAITPHLRLQEPMEVVGFGLVESAIGMATLIHQRSPESVLLVGIAGTFDPSTHPPGTAVSVGRTRIDGIGVGNNQDAEFESAVSLGWQSEDELVVDGSSVTALSVASASAGSAEASWRQSRFASASIEDMETYCVVALCHRFGIPVRVIRGISNVVGDRNHDRWQIESACVAIGKIASQISFERPNA